MQFFEKELDITRNIRMIEWLKSQILADVSNLFSLLVNGFKEEVQEHVSDTLANLILVAFVLGKRLGTTYTAIQLKVESKIKLGIIENTDIEKYYGDLSELARHMRREADSKGNDQ
jgi:hypothetical protein